MHTWPNAVTREFCESQLDGHKVFMPKTFVTSVFVDMLAGPLDMNNGLADLTQAGRVDQGVPVPSTLTAEIGEYIVMARQAADGAWLVGAATNESPRELDVPLSFLPAGKHEALVIQDGPKSDYRMHAEDYKAETREVTNADTLLVKLAPGGGACVLITQKR